jgi:nucleoside-diphosphate-sugar epimerase
MVRALFTPGVGGETFNVTAGHGRSLLEAYQAVREWYPALEAEIQEGVVDFRPKRGTLDISNARELLGYEPVFPLEKGIAAYLEVAATLGAESTARQ